MLHLNLKVQNKCWKGNKKLKNISIHFFFISSFTLTNKLKQKFKRQRSQTAYLTYISKIIIECNFHK
jgi:hypothetical protein